MRILVNCLNTATGGGLRVATSLLSGLSHLNTGHEFLVIAPSHPRYRKLEGDPKIQFHWHTTGRFWPFRQVQYYRKGIRELAGRFHADALLSLTSLGAPGLSIPQFVILHQAFLVADPDYYRGFTPWRMRARFAVQQRFFREALPKVSALMVQSHFMETQIRRSHNFKGAIIKLPLYRLSEGVLNTATGPVHPALTALGNNEFKLFYASNYMRHKNFERLFGALSLLLGQGRKIKLITTVLNNETSNPFWRAARKFQVEGAIVNIGNVAPDEVAVLYRQADASVQLSLLEAYGLTYIEAMEYSRPQVVADRPFAREVCGDAAVYVPPESASGIAQGIASLMDSDNLRRDLVERGLRRLSRDFIGSDEHAGRVIAALEAHCRP